MTRSRRGVVAKEAWGGATRDGATWGRNYVNGAWAERRCQGDAEPRDAVQRVGRCYADVIWHGRGDVPKETVRRATRGRATCGMGYVDRRVYGRGNITKETLRRETLDAVTLTVTCRGAKLTGRRGAGRSETGRCIGRGYVDSIFKSRDITLPTKVHQVKAMVFTVVMYGCES